MFIIIQMLMCKVNKLLNLCSCGKENKCELKFVYFFLKCSKNQFSPIYLLSKHRRRGHFQEQTFPPATL